MYVVKKTREDHYSSQLFKYRSVYVLIFITTRRERVIMLRRVSARRFIFFSRLDLESVRSEDPNWCIECKCSWKMSMASLNGRDDMMGCGPWGWQKMYESNQQMRLKLDDGENIKDFHYNKIRN